LRIVSASITIGIFAFFNASPVVGDHVTGGDPYHLLSYLFFLVIIYGWARMPLGKKEATSAAHAVKVTTGDPRVAHVLVPKKRLSF